MDGLWEYEFTQAETNYVASELQVMVVRPASPPAFPLGTSFARQIVSVDMNAEDFAAFSEGSMTYGDQQRGMFAAMLGLVTDFRTGTLAFKSADGAKTRWTVVTDASGRISVVPGDLTP